jgi:hypothetical protein
MELVITDGATLLAACDALHDDLFDLNSVVFDAGDGSWSVQILRVVHDPASFEVRPGLVFDRVAAPIFNAVLRLEGVASFEVNDRSRIGSYHFNECRQLDDGYLFVFHEDMEFVVKFQGSPRGLLRDIGPSGRVETWRRFRQGS